MMEISFKQLQRCWLNCYQASNLFCSYKFAVKLKMNFWNNNHLILVLEFNLLQWTKRNNKKKHNHIFERLKYFRNDSWKMLQWKQMEPNIAWSKLIFLEWLFEVRDCHRRTEDEKMNCSDLPFTFSTIGLLNTLLLMISIEQQT